MAWITTGDVVDALGTPAPTAPGDVAHLERVTDAACGWAFDRRAAAGYTDDPNVVPSARVAAGTVAYAVALWRERGTVDSFASFEQMGGPVVVPGGSHATVLRLLGIPRPVAV